MDQFTPAGIANWTSLYLATALCCGLGFALSVTITLHGAWRERVWQEVGDVRGAVLFLPRLWWRWQKLYLLSTPVTLGIVGAFAASLSW